jgi:hypothetical protein
VPRSRAGRWHQVPGYSRQWNDGWVPGPNGGWYSEAVGPYLLGLGPSGGALIIPSQTGEARPGLG